MAPVSSRQMDLAALNYHAMFNEDRTASTPMTYRAPICPSDPTETASSLSLISNRPDDFGNPVPNELLVSLPIPSIHW